RRGPGLEFAVQRTPVAELQREKGHPFLFADFVQLDDVWMIEAGDGLGLDLKHGGVLAGQDRLESDEAIGLDLPGLVDDAHAATADLLKLLIAFYRGDRRRIASQRYTHRASEPLDVRH